MRPNSTALMGQIGLPTGAPSKLLLFDSVARRSSWPLVSTWPLDPHIRNPGSRKQLFLPSCPCPVQDQDEKSGSV